MEDRWICKLHSFNRDNYSDNSSVLWLKVVLLKVSPFVRRLLLNCVPKKDNLVRLRGSDNNEKICS